MDLAESWIMARALQTNRRMVFWYSRIAS